MTVLSGTWKERSSPEITPALSELYRPNGLPTTKASSPTRTRPGLPSTAAGMPWGGAPALMTAVSFSGDWLTIWAGALLPSAKVTRIEVAPAMT